MECPLPGPLTIACAFAPPSLLVNQSTLVVEATFRSEGGDSGAGIRANGGPIVGILSAQGARGDRLGEPPGDALVLHPGLAGSGKSLRYDHRRSHTRAKSTMSAGPFQASGALA